MGGGLSGKPRVLLQAINALGSGNIQLEEKYQF